MRWLPNFLQHFVDSSTKGRPFHMLACKYGNENLDFEKA